MIRSSGLVNQTLRDPRLAGLITTVDEIYTALFPLKMLSDAPELMCSDGTALLVPDKVVDPDGTQPFYLTLLHLDPPFSNETLISDIADTPRVNLNATHFQITTAWTIIMSGSFGTVRIRIAHDAGGIYPDYASAVAAGQYFEIITFDEVLLSSHQYPCNSPVIPVGSKVWAAINGDNSAGNIHANLIYGIREITV